MSSMKQVKEIFIVILLGAILLPIAFELFFGTDTGNWSATTVLVWVTLPVVAIVTIALKFFDKI